MALHRPAFTYNSPAVTLALTIPARPWAPVNRTVGGTDVATSGVRESFLLRRDHLLTLQLRFRESEWTAVESWITWAQANPGTAFSFLPDGVGTAAHSVYLEAPQVDEDVAPTRDEFAGAYALDVTLRRVSGTWDVRYF